MRASRVSLSLQLVAWAAIAACGRAPEPAEDVPVPRLRLERVADGFSSPVGVRHAKDGSGRLFVVEQGGAIRVIPRDGTRANPVPFLEFFGPDEASPPFGLTAGGEQGLLGLAFHPDYAHNRTFFIDYTDALGDTVVARFRARADDPERADPASGEVLLRVDQNYSNHNGGDIAFGPDGFLYIALGDGGAGGDPCRHGQTLAPSQLGNGDAHGHCAPDSRFQGIGANANARALLGKLLRIDVDHQTPPGANRLCAANADGSARYAVPATNPYAPLDAQPPGACAETWAYGLRNPWRIAFDRENGDLYIGDVGQDRFEEVDFQPATGGGGRNYGWNRCEADEAYGSEGAACPLPDDASTPRPILSYPHERGDCSVTGGYRYRGPIAGLRGTYVYGDYCTGRIWLARPGPGRWRSVPWERADANISSFGEDEQGNLYLVDYAGGVKGKGNVRRFASAD